MSMAKLLAAQKAKREGTTQNATPSNLQTVRPETSSRDSSESTAEPVQSGPVADESPADTALSTAHGTDGVATGVAGKPAGLGLGGKLNLLKRGADSAKSTRPAEPARASVGAVAGGPDSDGSADFSLDDLAGFDESVAPALTESSSGSGFIDEIEATAPDRDLPPELERGQLSFVESLDNIYQVLNDPEMFGQSVRIIMSELQENPEYIKLVADQDVHTMIRAMRNTMGLARIKKQEKTRKPRAAAAAKKKGAVSDDVMGMLDGLVGGDDD